ncbi:MAG: flippase activity-associated protein Agl23, partial [Planctomycetota bacterium]
MTQFQRCLIFVLIAVVLALALRLPRLQLRPMHTDEAVHAMKFSQLLEQGSYTYNPKEYHGPTLNFFTLIPAWLSSQQQISQVNELTLRIVPLIFGVLLILLLLLLSDGLGPVAVGFAAILTAVSGAFVFYSRYYIQEMLLVCFTFGVIASGYRYLKFQKITWAVLCGLFLGLAHATKETCIISFASISMALIFIVVLQRRYSPSLSKFNKSKFYLHGTICVLIALVISALFYSSFFTNPQGILDSFTTYSFYFNKASNSNAHIHPWSYYLKMLTHFQVASGPVWSEAFVVVLACFGFICLLTKRYMRSFDPLLVRFIALYTFIMTVIYAVIPYKTPWSMLGFYHGIILMAAVGMTTFVKMAINTWRKIFIWTALSAGILFLVFQSFVANFYTYADPIYPYVYAHTSIDIFKITDRIKKVALVHPDKNDIYIQVIFPGHDYWPLPWYLRDF